MAIPVTPKPTYPNVPQAPGVPPLLRTIDEVQNDIVLIGADALSIINLLSTPQWGLFDSSGKPAFKPIPAAGLSGIVSTVLQVLGAGGQSVGEEEYSLDHRVSDAPQEQGSFVSYNKVSSPYAGRVTYLCGGTSSQRGAFLTAVKAAQQSLNLYSLVMPEITYQSCTIVHHSYRRTARNGITLIAVDVWVEEVRVTGTAAFTNTQAPSGAAMVNGGTVQPQTPAPNQVPGPVITAPSAGGAVTDIPGNVDGPGATAIDVSSSKANDALVPIYNSATNGVTAFQRP